MKRTGHANAYAARPFKDNVGRIKAMQETILKLHGEGMKRDAIAAHINRDPTVVTYHGKALGISWSNTTDGTRILRDRIIALHALGYNHAQIARVLCRTRQCISWNARQMGLERIAA